MHSKHTVKYICEQYPSGNCYYYKQEIITQDTWQNIGSLMWSTPRPISKGTFVQKAKQGYVVEHRTITKPPAQIISLPEREHFVKSTD
ncbi:hypothetical protein [Halalkalibacterium ligniniphilum]|uniref:hypothetical protein n=1 Tax=Halalkalibacterium ligniniphilum TaxID=1134413 RepID=UPI00034A8681|nr:hypothetical protein [Halalkalibacterium ligniniphilum]